MKQLSQEFQQDKKEYQCCQTDFYYSGKSQMIYTSFQYMIHEALF